MERTCATDRYVPASTWLTLSGATIQFVFAVTLLATTASVVAVSVGDPEAVALIGLLAIAVVVVGLALARGFEHCRTNGLPLVE